jgi:hypothetical protein
VSIAISILSGGWALGGFIDLVEEETSMGAGGWARAITLQSAGPWTFDGSEACAEHAISSHDWAMDGVAGAEDGYILGRHTRPGGLTRLSVG